MFIFIYTIILLLFLLFVIVLVNSPKLMVFIENHLQIIFKLKKDISFIDELNKDEKKELNDYLSEFNLDEEKEKIKKT